jgi:choline dehydrogenase-like flavoprotein
MSQPPHSWFHDVVSSLAYSLSEPHATKEFPSLDAPYNDVTNFLLSQHSRIASQLRGPLQMASLAFDIEGLLRTGRKFHHQRNFTRGKQIAAWKTSKLGFKRDLIRYFESLAMLSLYSRDDAKGASPDSIKRDGVLENHARELKCEIAVVGSGPGGAITAALLAEAGRDVLLIEEGEYLSLSSCVPFTRDEMVQKYRNRGQTVAFGANKIAYVEGRCVGGGSEINSGLYHRTPPEVLETWRKQFQVEGLADSEMLPHFEACENDLSVSLMPGPAPAASLRLHDGATKLGWKSLEIPRWFKYEPGACDSTRGKRQSMTETFVPRFLASKGRLLPRTRVNHIRQDGAKWMLDAEDAATQSIRITAETLFVCAGAVQTPALLRRSGITRNIGNSMRMHPTLKVVAKFSDEVNSAQMGVPAHQVKEFAPRFSFGCSISTPPYLAVALLDLPERAREVSKTWHNLATYYAMITGEGRGSVRALSGFRDPLVRYGLTANDRRDLAEGLGKLCEALFAGGATSLYPGIAGAAELKSRDDLKKLPAVLPSGMASLMTIHLFSSCSMGEDKSKCATDSFGRVHGFKNLVVNDASLLCTAPGVNPQGSVMAIARRNTLKFLDHQK